MYAHLILSSKNTRSHFAISQVECIYTEYVWNVFLNEYLYTAEGKVFKKQERTGSIGSDKYRTTDITQTWSPLANSKVHTHDLTANHNRYYSHFEMWLQAGRITYYIRCRVFQ